MFFFTFYIRKTIQCPKCMKTYLVCWVFEFCSFPKHFPGNFTLNIVIHIIPNLVIDHWSFNNVVIMYITGSARSNKVQPFI